jgi:hypothetical protein
MTDAYSLSECVFPYDILVLVGKALVDAFAIPGPGAVRRESPRACNVYFLQVSKALTRLLEQRVDDVWPRTCRVPLPWTSIYHHTLFYISLAAGDLLVQQNKVKRLLPLSWAHGQRPDTGLLALTAEPQMYCQLGGFGSPPDATPYDWAVYVDLGVLLCSMLGPWSVELRPKKPAFLTLMEMTWDGAIFTHVPSTGAMDTLPIIIAQGFDQARLVMGKCLSPMFVGLVVPIPGEFVQLSMDGLVGEMTMQADFGFGPHHPGAHFPISGPDDDRDSASSDSDPSDTEGF